MLKNLSVLVVGSLMLLAGCSKPSAPTADKSTPVTKVKSKPVLKLISDEGVLQDQDGGKYYWRSYFLKKVRYVEPQMTTEELKKKLGPPDSTTIGLGGDATRATWIYTGITVDENNDKIDRSVEVRFKNGLVVAVEFNP